MITRSRKVPRAWPKYPDREQVTLREFERRGQAGAFVSDWIETDQALFDDFAAATGDDALIHTDPGAAAKTRFGGTIAHGLLSLSLLPFMLRSAIPEIRGTRMGINYGYDRIRFLAPVPCGARLRGVFDLVRMEQRDGGLLVLHFETGVEMDGSEKLALSARWLLGRWLVRNAKQPDD